MKRKNTKTLAIALVLLFLSACGGETTPSQSSTITPHTTPSPTASPTPTPTPSPVSVPTPDSSPDVNDTPFIWYEMTREGDRLASDITLEYDEIFIYEYKGNTYYKRDPYILCSEEDVARYYPNFDLAAIKEIESLKGFSFDLLFASNQYDPAYAQYPYNDGKSGVVKIDLSGVYMATIEFIKNDLCISIDVMFSETDMIGDFYQPLGGEYSKYYMTTNFNDEINGFCYSENDRYIWVRYGTSDDSTNADGHGVVLESILETEEELIDLIDAFDLGRNMDLICQILG